MLLDRVVLGHVPLRHPDGPGVQGAVAGGRARRDQVPLHAGLGPPHLQRVLDRRRHPGTQFN